MLSVIVPGIRPWNWQKLYDSVKESLVDSDDFEVIFVGPHTETVITNGIGKVRFIEDWGSPARAMNIGLEEAVSDTITWAADDGYFLPTQLDKMYGEYYYSSNYLILTGKYYEGSNNPQMLSDSYYKIGNSIDCKGLAVDISDWWLLNIGLIDRKLLLDYGGWNGRDYETTFGAHLDLAIRLQADGIKFSLYEQPIFYCDHMPGITSDHAPIHYAHSSDMAMIRDKYSRSPIGIKISPANWKEAPNRWVRRFGQ